jgi:hypothetical protein
MNCSTCKNPVNPNDAICEWCNSSLYGHSKIKETSNVLYKGELIFYSDRVKKHYCFFEIYLNEILIFNYDDDLNIRILKSVIYNIRRTNLLSKRVLVPMDFMNSYSLNGWIIITSKSGENIIYLKKQNYEKFKLIIEQYYQH